MGQAINRNKRLATVQSNVGVNTIWGEHLKISGTNPNLSTMVWNTPGPDGNTNINNTQNIHNISPESILPPLPIPTDWMTHMTYLPMDKVDTNNLDNYYINNAIKGNKTFYNLTKGRLYKLCMHPTSSRMFWQRMYTPGYDMMFSPVVGTPSDYDNGDCLLFTNAFRISDQSYNIVKYNTLTMEITVLHTWLIEPVERGQIKNIYPMGEKISSTVYRYCGSFDFGEIRPTAPDGSYCVPFTYYKSYIKNKKNSIRLFTWCDYLRNGKYAILKYGDGTDYMTMTSGVYDRNNSLLTFDIYTNTITTVVVSIPNLSNHGRPKFINTFSSTRDDLVLIFEEAGDVYRDATSKIASTDMCYSEMVFDTNDGVGTKHYAACLSLVNQRMIFGKDLYGVNNIRNKNDRVMYTNANLRSLSRFNNPYIEYYDGSSTNMKDQAPWIRFFSVNLLTKGVIQDTREKPNENADRLKSAIIPGMSFCLGGHLHVSNTYLL